MKVTNYDRLMEQIAEALRYEFKTDVCDHVEFHDQFPRSRTYARTVSVERRFYITYDKECNEIEFYDTAKSWRESWVVTYRLEMFSKMELAIRIYSRIARLLAE